MSRTALTLVLVASLVPAARAQTLTIANITIVDVTNGHLSAHMNVAVDGKRIAAVSSKAFAASSGATLDGTGIYLIPGLWDMHVHAFFTNDSSRFHTTSELMFPLFVAHGVTGVRDMGSNLNAILAARDSVAAHQLIGPRMVVAGPMLDGTTSRYQTIIKVGTADDARAAVQMLKQRGVDTVAVGKLADLVILSRNPLTEIGNTRSVVAIVADGRYFSPADLGRMRLHLMELAAK